MQDEGQQAESGQHEKGLQRAAGAEQHRHGEDRPELAVRTVVHDDASEPGAQQAGVLEDRQEGAQRGGGQRDRDRDLTVDLAGAVEQQHDAERDEQAGDPRDERAAPAAADELGRLDLVAREQEQHAEPQLAQHRDALACDGELEHVRADQDAEHEEQHHLRHLVPQHQADEQRSEHGTQGDPEQRLARARHRIA